VARRFPRYGWIGLALIALFWPLNWALDGLRTHWGFFPLWLGYCLTVDGLNVYRRGTSLLTRNRRRYLGLFFISVPVWWIFEAVNLRTQNWLYVGREFFTDLEYGVLASLSFSTVIPAVLGSAELMAGFDFIGRFRNGPVIRPDRRTTATFFLLGGAMLAALLAWPRYFFPFTWLFLYFLIEPINVWLGHRSLGEWTRKGDWRPVMALWMGVLLTAFFWEMWNYFSYPKWIYDVPFVDFFHIFEMPILGYFGYLPFALELVAAVHLAYGLLGGRRADYVFRGLVVG
jgi:hypothetical protein